jgi:hypothetical protein
MYSLQKNINLINVAHAFNILAAFGNQYGEALAKLAKALNVKHKEWFSNRLIEFGNYIAVFKTPFWDKPWSDAFMLNPSTEIYHYFTNRGLVQHGVKGSKKGDTIISIFAVLNGAIEKVELIDNPTSINIKDSILWTYIHMVKKDSDTTFKSIYDTMEKTELNNYPEDVEGFFKPTSPNIAGWVRKFDLNTFLYDQQEVITVMKDILPKMV